MINYNEIPFPYEVRNVFHYKYMERLIEETYGRKLDILEYYAEYMGNYSCKTMDIFDGKFPDSIPLELDEWNDEAAEKLVLEWAKNGGDVDDELVIWHLMYTGKLPEGKYLMELDW